MLDKAHTDIRSLRDTAVKLIRCVGAKAASDYCRNQEWHGLYDEVRLISTFMDRR